MRLIDADALIEAMKKTEDEYEKAMTCPSWWSAFNVISEQMTAYDVSKVVEKFEEKARTVNVIGYGAIYEAINKDVAIEIVKNGGVGTETETIRDKAVKWNNNSSKRVPYEFIDYVEGKREIGVSDDVCKWKVFDNSLADESPQWVYETTCGKYVSEEH